jgi:hypothetical protein
MSRSRTRARCAAIAAALGATCALPAVTAAQVTRTEVIERAKDFTYYPWRAAAANLTAACHANYQSAYVVGDFMGVAYDWGGFDSLFQFSEKLRNGQAAGSPAGGLVSSCTTGVDCSGFVSRAWKTSSKYGTATLHQISTPIQASQMLPGDVFNDANNHVALYSHVLANGLPYLYEAAFTNTHVNAHRGWSWVNGFIPRRYQSITGTTVGNPIGTLSNPITIGALPFSDARDTRSAPSAVLDGCALAPATNETGPEYVYKLVLAQPGQLTVSVSDDATADIDVHLLTSWNTSDCVARHDSTFTKAVDCGTYYIVADTYGGAANAGNFNLTVSLVPSGAACGNGPPTYAPLGAPGDACEFPGDRDLPACNPTLGGEVCLFTSTTSFCSAGCATDADCGSMPGGGCCQDLGNSERYCMTQGFCGGGGSGSGSGGGLGSGDGSGEGDGGGDGDGDGDGDSDDDAPGGDGDRPGGGCATAPASSGLVFAMIAALGPWTRCRRRCARTA